MGGTKGSHLFTFHEPLRTALASGGIYTEAADGRPVFLLPLAGGVLVGTTDLPFTGNPADAVANETEITYLLACVRHVFPQVDMQPEQIAWHYSGVRPLPYVDASSTAAITRRHALKQGYYSNRCRCNIARSGAAWSSSLAADRGEIRIRYFTCG
jgi:glycerol-3-phosphate dehydrogenase